MPLCFIFLSQKLLVQKWKVEAKKKNRQKKIFQSFIPCAASLQNKANKHEHIDTNPETVISANFP